MSDFYKAIKNDENFYRIECKGNVFCELIIGDKNVLLFSLLLGKNADILSVFCIGGEV